MKNVKRCVFITAAFLVLVIVDVEAGAPFKKVSLATTTKPTTSTAADETADGETSPVAVAEVKHEHTNTTSKAHDRESKLTGIPQIDYVWDPNLPRELNGYNLSSYPFLSTTPPNDEIHFKCDGLHDGFYASIEYKCQVYHHCVYGIRHDFLCANFTAFDQKTFICHFASTVDCEGSQKYWNRNDNLYMATTTSTTSTTTTEPPPIQRRRPINRPLRPLRRPSNRRPIDDYYYEDEQYDEDYYEERANKRRKQRPRQRKPVVEYDDEYEDEKRSFSDEKPRRTSSRDRFRDDDPEDDYEPRNKPADRRKINNRKSGTIGRSPAADERRSFSDDRPAAGGRRKSAKPAIVDDPIEPAEAPRRPLGRRRINEKRSSTTASPINDDFDDLDEYERPHSQIPDQEEAAADEDVPPKIKTTPKPLEEFVTPKAAPSSVFARPRAPPRIARPVPVNEKSKFKYPIQKTGTTSAPSLGSHSDDEEYYEDEEYDDVRSHKGQSKKRIAEDEVAEEDEVPAPKRGILGRKPIKTLRKPITEKKVLPAADEEEDYETPDRYESRGSSSRRRNPLTGRNRNRTPVRDDVDFVDDDYEERPSKRGRPNARKTAKKPRIPEPVDEIEEEVIEVEPEKKPIRSRGGPITSRRKNAPSIPSRSRSPAAQAVALVSDDPDELDAETAEDVDVDASSASSKSNLPTSRPTSVRVVKRPFLPSRGGSPYLPRGLQPVGIAHKSLESHTTDSSLVDMFSTNSGVHLLEHGAPLLRDSGPRTTLPPRSAIPVSQPRPESSLPSSKATLDELYENDYDVTLNDALNPTLKPLSPHQSTHYHQQHHDNNNNNRLYQSSIYSPLSSSDSSSSSSLSPSDSFVYKNQSPSSSSSSPSTSSSAHLPSSQNSQIQYQPQVSQSQSQSQSYHQNQQLQQQPLPSQHQFEQTTNNHDNNYNSDSYFSSTDIRRRTIVSPSSPQSSRSEYRRTGNGASRVTQNYYDDDYEY